MVALQLGLGNIPNMTKSFGSHLGSDPIQKAQFRPQFLPVSIKVKIFHAVSIVCQQLIGSKFD